MFINVIAVLWVGARDIWITGECGWAGVEGALDTKGAAVQDVGIDHGGGDVPVAQQILNGADVGSGFQQMVPANLAGFLMATVACRESPAAMIFPLAMCHADFSLAYRCLAIPLALSLLPACSTSAIVGLHDRRQVQGRLVDADAEVICVHGGGPPIAVPRSDIGTIDHPGNVVGVIGTAIVVTGTLLIVLSAAARANEDSSAWDFTPLGVAYLGIGAPIAVWGFGVHHRSKAVANHRQGPMKTCVDPIPLPPFQPVPSRWDPQGGSDVQTD